MMEQLFTVRREKSGNEKERREQLFTAGEGDRAENANRRNSKEGYRL